MALLIDYDNLQLCAQRDAPGSDLDLRSVVGLAQRYGTLLVARAYAEWNNPTERLDAYKAGIEPVFAPVLRTDGPAGKEGKSLADPVMVADGVDLMWSHAPSVYVLVTSDKDMIPLARLAKQRGAKVVVIGSDLTAVPLREISDEFFSYRRVVQEITGVLLGPGQQGGRAPQAVRQTRSQPTQRSRTPAAPVAPTPPLAASAPPVEDQPAPTEAAPIAAGEVSSEERPGLPGTRRRRRRGGRGRGRSAQPGPGEAVAEAPVSADDAYPTSAERPLEDDKAPPESMPLPGMGVEADIQQAAVSENGEGTEVEGQPKQRVRRPRRRVNPAQS